MNRTRGRKLFVSVTIGTSAFSFLRGQLAWFQEQGWDVTLVATPDEKAYSAAEREGVKFAGIEMRREISPRRDLGSLVKWITLLRNEKPDVVNFGTPKAALLGSLASWITRVPRRVYTVRGLRLEGTSGPLSLVLWCMESLTMLLATDVLFVSKSLAEEARRRRLLRNGKSWIIGSGSSNGVDAQAIADRVRAVDRDELRKKFGFSADHFVVGFVGRVNRDKGVDTLARAFRNADLRSDIYGLLIGPVEDVSLANEIGFLNSRIKSVSWTDDVWGHLPAMDVLCLPTLREGFPNVVIEAAAAGVPTITTRATGAIDSVVPGVTGELIEIGDDIALVARLNELASDRSLGRRLGEAGRRRVFQDFTQEGIWQGILEIIEAKEYSEKATRVTFRN